MDKQLESLIQAAQSGDQIAAEAIVRHLSATVKIHARTLYLSGGDAEDLIQEGMLGLLSAIRTYTPDGGASFETYADLLIRRTMLNAVRAGARRKHAPLNESVPLEIKGMDDWTNRYAPLRELEDTLLLKSQIDDLRKLGTQVLSKFEQLILSLFLDGLSYAQIAQNVERTQKSVDNAIQRIRKKLALHQ